VEIFLNEAPYNAYGMGERIWTIPVIIIPDIVFSEDFKENRKEEKCQIDFPWTRSGILESWRI
jgi:hypothetical protein